MSDSMLLMLFVALTCLLSAGFAIIVRRRRPHWSRLKVSLLSALPLPGLVALLSLLIIGRAFVDSVVDRESCGVDACGMEMGFSAIILFCAALVYAAGVAIATSVIFIMQRTNR